MNDIRIVYLAGPGDIISAHRSWSRGEKYPNENSLTFSSQVADFCREMGAQAYFFSYHSRREHYDDGAFRLEHRPKIDFISASGIKFHIYEWIYAFSILLSCLRFHCNLLIMESGHIPAYFGFFFHLLGIEVIVTLQNTLWPKGFYPISWGRRLGLWLDARFYRTVARAILCISPECERQVRSLTKKKSLPIIHFRPQFMEGEFSLTSPPEHGKRPFRIAYIGRIVQAKGVFDILEMARRIDLLHPGAVEWVVCGRGPDLESLRKKQCDEGLEKVVRIRRWISQEETAKTLRESHIAIVPTRSDFSEGLAMTVVEAILAGRPVITSSVVPASELMQKACLEAPAENVDSFIGIIEKLLTRESEPIYRELCDSCPSLTAPFFDRDCGLTAALKKAMSSSILIPSKPKPFS